MSKLTAQIAKLRAAIADAQGTIDSANAQLPDLIAKHEAEVAEAEARARVETTGFPPGTLIIFEYGRGATRTEKAGTVLAFRPKTDNLPAAYKVQTGEGFDAEVLTVLAVNVKAS
jgi:hypothetical protein